MMQQGEAMYRNYPNTLSPDGSFSASDVRTGMIALHTDYCCPLCNKVQSVAQMSGYGGCCIKCGESSQPINKAVNE